MELDLDWIEEENKMIHIEKNIQREPMSSVSIHFVYINNSSSIEKVVTEKHLLSNEKGNEKGSKDCSVLKKETLLKIINEKKQSLFLTKYVFMDILIYNIDLEPNYIQNYVQGLGSPSFLKTMPIPDDILFQPSIFIFHPLNAIYIFFLEKDKDISLNPKPRLSGLSDKEDMIRKKHSIFIPSSKIKSRKFLIRETDNNKTRKNINN
jgi:hypothetical protein